MKNRLLITIFLKFLISMLINVSWMKTIVKMIDNKSIIYF